MIRILRTTVTLIALALLAVALVASLAGTFLASGDGNLYVQQAAALLKGRLDVPFHLHDMAIYEGRYYVPFPPFPAVLLLPLVAIFGVKGTLPVVVCTVLAIASVFVLRRILQRLEVPKATIPWMLAAFFLGTAYWGCLAMSSGVWFVAHIVAILALFLAVNEGLGRSRGWLVGLYMGMAILTRQFMVALLPLLAMLVWRGAADRRHAWRQLVAMAAVLAPFGAAYLAFNWLRFGSPLDTGYGYMSLGGFLKRRFERYGLFDIAYVPTNLMYLLFQGFHVEFGDKLAMGDLARDPFGTSLIGGSPFLLLALGARWKKWFIVAAWVSIALCALPMLCYYTQGWVQYNGQRYAMDYVPIVMLLAALGAKEAPGWLWKLLVGYAIVLNILAQALLPVVFKAS